MEQPSDGAAGENRCAGYPPRVSIVGLDHVQVAAPARCEDEARAFYGGLLGLEEIPKPTLLAAPGGCWFRVGAQELHVGVVEGFLPATKAHPGIVVGASDALETVAERLVKAGAALTRARCRHVAR